jgi:hypothetical protein
VIRAGRGAACVALAALALSGCGGDDGSEEDVRQVRDVVNRFAGAEDREACDLLTDEALVELYGGGSSSATSGPAVDRAEDACVERSAQFRGARVRIEKVDIVAERAARVKAFNEPHDREYNLLLRKPEGEDDWLIDQIIQKPVPRA